MKICDIIKSIQSSNKINPTTIKNLESLGSDLNLVKYHLENELTNDGYQRNSDEWIKQASRQMGILCEYIMSLAVYLKPQSFVKKYGSDFKLCLWNKQHDIYSQVNSILDISGGNSSTGAIDILVEDRKNKMLWAYSSKMKKIYTGKISWSQTEVDKMRVIESQFNTTTIGWKFNYGVVIYNRKDFVNESKPHRNVEVVDFTDLMDIWKECFSLLSEYRFDSTIIDGKLSTGKINVVPRFHQVMAMAQATAYFTKNQNIQSPTFYEKSFLFDHICRSGKTITALLTAKSMDAKNILLITSYPVVNETEWSNTINRFIEFDWNVVDFSNKRGTHDSNKSNFVMISMQDLKSNDGDNVCYGWEKGKFDDIRDIHWDLVIGDEIHTGFETEKSKAVIEPLQYDHFLALSATPFVNYAKGTFDSINTNRWTLFDETEKAKTEPIYASYPNIHFLLFSVPQKHYQDFLNDNPNDAITFGKLMRVNESTGDFFYKKDVETLMNFTFGNLPKAKQKETPYGYMRSIGMDCNMNGVLIFVQECIHGKLLKKMLLENPKISSMFNDNIYYTDSDTNKSSELPMFIEKIQTSHEKFIMIAVGQLTTGVTMKDVDTVILMNDEKSPQALMQKMFRCRTARDNKQHAFVIDLNPTRVFDVFFDYTATLAIASKTSQLAGFQKFFDLIDVVHNGKVINCEKDIMGIYQQCSKKYYNYFGKGDFLNDELLIGDINFLASINFLATAKLKNMQYEEGNEKGKTVDNGGGGGGLGLPVPPNPIDLKKLAREHLKAIVETMPWLCILTGCNSNQLDEMFDIIEKNETLKALYLELLFG